MTLAFIIGQDSEAKQDVHKVHPTESRLIALALALALTDESENLVEMH
jgi:hypothetical protein